MRGDRKALDAAVRLTLGLGPDVDCSEIWAAVKAKPDRAEFEASVHERLGREGRGPATAS
jgi:hypothetical protein